MSRQAMPLRRAVLGLLALAAARAAMAAPATPSAASVAPLRAGMFDPAYPAPELGLRGSDGTELSLRRYRGKVVLLVFGYTRCSEVCPVTLATLTQARRALGSAGDAVQVVYVTVDPGRDDMASIKAYLRGFDAGFIGGTGPQAAIDRVLKSYGAVAEKVDQRGADYSMGHTAAVYLVDRQGRLRGMMPFGRDAKDYVHDLRLLLAS